MRKTMAQYHAQARKIKPGTGEVTLLQIITDAVTTVAEQVAAVPSDAAAVWTVRREERRLLIEGK